MYLFNVPSLIQPLVSSKNSQFQVSKKVPSDPGDGEARREKEKERRQRKAISRISDVPLRSDTSMSHLGSARRRPKILSVRRFVHNARARAIVVIGRSIGSLCSYVVERFRRKRSNVSIYICLSASPYTPHRILPAGGILLARRLVLRSRAPSAARARHVSSFFSLSLFFLFFSSFIPPFTSFPIKAFRVLLRLYVFLIPLFLLLLSPSFFAIPPICPFVLPSRLRCDFSSSSLPVFGSTLRLLTLNAKYTSFFANTQNNRVERDL